MNTMTKKQQRKERELTAAMALARVADISIHEAFGELAQFRSWERSLQRLAEMDCNGYPKQVIEYRDGQRFHYNVTDEALQARCEKREERITQKVKDAATRLGISVEFQGDPRGLMFRLTYNGQEFSFYEVA